MKLKERRQKSRTPQAIHHHFGRAVAKATMIIAVLLMLFTALALFERLGLGITGFTVAEKSFTTALNKEITSVAAEKTVADIPVTLEAAPKSFSISGKLEGHGTAKAYLVLNGQKYLILDTAQLQKKEAETLLAITGRIVEEAQEQAQAITTAVVNTLTTTETDNATVINETEANETQLPTLQQPEQPQPNKTITVQLRYNNGTAFDSNDDGIETEKGAIDFTISETQFSWPADEGKLCTRWKTESPETNTMAAICNGNSNCCQLVELAPQAESWKEPLQVFYGSFNGAVGYKNNVSAQVIYADYSLETATATVDVAYSGWQTLPAKFLKVTEFKAACEETCKLPPLQPNETGNAIILVELENAEAATILTIESVSYTASVIVNTAPAYTAIPAIEVKKNSAATVNLSQYFTDAEGDKLSYTATSDSSQVIISIAQGEIAAVEPRRGFTGNTTADFTASDGFFATSSGKVKITVAGEKLNSPPLLLKGIENVTIAKNKQATLNLSSHFYDADGDMLTYEAYKANDITMTFSGDTATIKPDKGFIGKRPTFITAADKENATAVSNIFTIEVVKAEEAEKEETEEVLGRIEINKPVKWKKTIRLTEETNATTQIPAAATTITVKENNISIEDKVKVEEKGKAKKLKEHLNEKKPKQKTAATASSSRNNHGNRRKHHPNHRRKRHRNSC